MQTAALFATLCWIAAVEPSAAGEPEIIYSRTGTLSEDGSRDEDFASGSNIVAQRDGSEFVVGPSALEDPDGNRYKIQWTVGQAAESEPVTVGMSITKYSKETLSDEQLVEEYLRIMPDATDHDVELMFERRSRGSELPSPHRHIDDEVATWAGRADADERLPILVLLTEQPAQGFPQIQTDLLTDDPVASLEQMEKRVLAIEEYQNLVEEIQAPIVESIADSGGSTTDEFWLVNALTVEASPTTVERLWADTRVLRIESVSPAVALANQGVELQDASQVTQFLDAGVDGETGSGRSAANSIRIAVVDIDIDTNHPAWKDNTTSSSRLLNTWRYSGGSWSTVTSSATSSDSHGTLVAGNLIADLTDGQDASVSGATDRRDRSGMTYESVFDFIEVGGGTNVAIEKAVALDVDIANMSVGVETDFCDNDSAMVTEVDNAYLDGVFWVSPAGNSDHDTSDCTVNKPANAAGAFAVGGTDYTASNLNTAPIWYDSSRGGDAKGRPLIHLAAPAGRSSLLTDYNNTYLTSAKSGTSLAAPIVAGVVADFKDHMIDQHGATFANMVGNLYATMLLFGDGTLESGGTATAQTPIDELWGAGRLRARMYGAAGMDAPWKGGWCSWTLDDAEVVTCDVNNDGSGNSAIPADADLFKATLWWYEPNVGTGEDPAVISFGACKVGTGGCYATSGTEPQMKRVRLGSVFPGYTWQIKVVGADIPASTDSSYYYSQQKRYVHAAFYWEDQDRDDADGPPSSIQ